MGKSKGKGSSGRQKASYGLRTNWEGLQTEMHARHRMIAQDMPVDPYTGKQGKLDNPPVGRLVHNVEDFAPSIQYLHDNFTVGPKDVPLSIVYITKSDLARYNIRDQADALQRTLDILEQANDRPADDFACPINDVGTVWKKDRVDVLARINNGKLMDECRILYEAIGHHITAPRSRTVIHLAQLVINPQSIDNSFIKNMNELLPDTVNLSGMTLLRA